MDGSAIGIGSDIAGSLRMPPSYCGIYGFKPIAERISGYGTTSELMVSDPIYPVSVTFVASLEPDPGYEAVRSCFGPLARYACGRC